MVRLLLPGYRELLRKLSSVQILGWLELQGAGQVHTVRILQSQHPDYPFPLWIVDCPALFDRPGNPYLQPNGYDWADNAERYTVFARAAAELARDALQLGWTPDVVHAHDWQTGLVPAFLDMLPQRPQRVFTIHNMAYGGHFSQADFVNLHLPSYWWSAEGAEFYGGFSMLKAGIVYSDVVTTVSPTYAREICTPAFGYGMDGACCNHAVTNCTASSMAWITTCGIRRLTRNCPHIILPMPFNQAKARTKPRCCNILGWKIPPNTCHSRYWAWSAAWWNKKAWI